MNPYDIHELIARNATLSYHEPDDNGGDVKVSFTCQQIITAGISYDQYMRATKLQLQSKPIPSANDMIVDWMIVHWAQVEPIASTQQLPAQGFNGYAGDESKVTPFDGAPILPIQPEELSWNPSYPFGAEADIPDLTAHVVTNSPITEDGWHFWDGGTLHGPFGTEEETNQILKDWTQPPTDEEQDKLDSSEFDEGRMDREWLEG